MTIEKAIWNAMRGKFIPCKKKTKDTLFKAFERNIPMKVLVKDKMFVCRNCWNNGKVTCLLWVKAIPNENNNYCSCCGQKIDWRNIDNGN